VARRRRRETFDVEDPATGETVAEVADGTPDDAAAALDAACAVQAEWATHPPRERGEILRARSRP
jgi:succinate-semialdehyde dehydrogenase/glutarate-semialdehyde dehydrogenase